jgi:hypothetical protein
VVAVPSLSSVFVFITLKFSLIFFSSFDDELKTLKIFKPTPVKKFLILLFSSSNKYLLTDFFQKKSTTKSFSFIFSTIRLTISSFD